MPKPPTITHDLESEHSLNFKLALLHLEARERAIQEVDKAAARTGFIDQPQALGKGFPDYFWVYGPTVDALSRHHPRGNERRQFGNMILSRWPIVQSRNLLYTPRLGGANHLSVQLGLLETVIVMLIYYTQDFLKSDQRNFPGRSMKVRILIFASGTQTWRLQLSRLGGLDLIERPFSWFTL